jgi:hypothetical protein
MYGGIKEYKDWSYGEIPIDVRQIQEEYINGSKTPSMLISLGADIQSNNKVANIENVVYLFAQNCAFTTDTLSLRSQNLHRSGSSRASPVWCVIPKNLVAVNLMERLHKYAIGEITIYVLAYIGSSPSPITTETRTFKSCFITYVDPWRGDFVIFAFTFVELVWELKDFNQRNDGTQEQHVGQRVYTFKFDDATGTLA